MASQLVIFINMEALYFNGGNGTNKARKEVGNLAVRKILIFTSIAIAVFFTIGYTAIEDSGQTDLKTYYDAFIDELISRCEYKEATMFDSKLKNIRQAAAMACLKAAFLRTHKKILIEKLIAEGVGTKPHKIEHYINKEFFAVLRTAIKTDNHRNF